MKILQVSAVLLLLFLTARSRGNRTRSSTDCPTTIQLLSYFPCVTIENVTSLEECDIFAYIAAQLAMDEVNRSSEVLPGVEFQVIPFATGVCGKLI